MSASRTLFHKPITLGNINELFAHHAARFGGWSMTATPPESDPPSDTPPESDPPTETPPNSDVPDGYAVDTQGKSLGYPKETSVSDMKVEEQAAYWRHQSRRHEQRASEWKDAAGGKTPAEVKAERDELTRLRQAGMTDQERQIDQAKEDAAATARTEALTGVARLAFETALSHVPEEKRSTLIENLDLSKVITASGIDTDKVKSIAASISPGSVKGPDYGGGRRESKSASGVAAGQAMFAERKKPAGSASSTS